MKGTRKCISLLVAAVMLFSLAAPLALAADTDVTVLLNADFEADTVGQAPPKSEDGWTGNAINDIACLYVTEEGNGNNMLKAFHGDPAADPKTRTPRVEKLIPAVGITNLTVEYDILSSGGSSKLDFRMVKQSTNDQLGTITVPYKFTEWTHIKIEFDFKKNKAVIYANEQKQGEGSFDLAGEGAFRLYFMFMVAPDDSWIAIDNVKITTTDKDLQRGETTSAGDYNEEFAKPESGDNLTVLMDTDYDNDIVGGMPPMTANGWSMSAINNLACLYVTETEDGNRELRAFHGNPEGNPERRTPRVEKILPTEGLTNLTIDYDIRTSGGENKLTVNFVTTDTNTVLGQLQVPFRYTQWTHTKIKCDFVKKTAVIYINGKEHATRTFEVSDAESFKVRFMFTVEPTNDWISIDNVKMTTTDKDPGGTSESMVSYDGRSINWSKVKVEPAEKTGMLEVMRKSHPRIFVNDWQQILDKVATDETAKAWYDKVISTANGVLESEPVAYYRNDRNNINNCSTQFKVNILPTAAAYCLTKDVRYKDRIYRELENVGNWPDWGADAYLCTAHIILGFAVCYDWLYYDWTDEERANIATWLINKGMSEAVLAYEEYNTSVNINIRANNWNNVCNGSNLIGALAIADEYPDVADYVLRKAANAIPYSFAELTADGAYIEPLNYWDYGIRHQVKLMSALDTALADGQSLPACLDFKNAVGMDNTGDFPIYYNGMTATFNYGDAVPGLVVSPIMYYLANKYNKPQYAWYALYMPENNSFTSNYSGKDATLALLWYDPDNSSIEENGFALDKFYQSKQESGTNGMSMRSSWEDTDGIFVAMNGGDANASHSNMDAGGFVLDWAGKRWVHMYGRNPAGISTTYGWPNFHGKSPEGHYSYYHCRAEANNTIIANPIQDMTDMQMGYYAELIGHASGTNTAYGIIDMTQTNADYKDAKRGMMLTGNRDVIVIQDEIKAAKPSEFYWFVNTNADITIAEDGKSALWEMDGDRMLVRITQGPADAAFGIMPAQPLPTSPDPSVQPDIEEHKMFMHMQNATELNLTVEFVPLAEGEGIPAPQPVVPLANWSVDAGAQALTSQVLGDIVALKVDNPNAYAKGTKTYVDTENLDIMPLVQNGRTLVPVRFIAEKFGASVGWNEPTQTVTVKTKTQTITLQIGNNTMMVGDSAVTLDVPAQTIGGRTLIPLRALVEALGKQVFWDDRGLILISDKVLAYDAAKIDKIIALLDTRVLVGGEELKFFDSEVYDYAVELSAGAAVPEATVLSSAQTSVIQGNPATVTVGDKTYTIRFTENPFASLVGTGSDGVLKTLYLRTDNTPVLPAEQTYLTIADAESSVDWNEKYPKKGTFDGVISAETQNRWSVDGVGNWICYDLGMSQPLHSIAIAGYLANTGRAYTFEIAISNDGTNFEIVHPEALTDGVSDRNVFSLGGKTARYVKITGVKTSNTTWVGINEVRIYADAAMEAADQAAWDAYFYTDVLTGKVGDTVRIHAVGESKGGQEIPVDLAEVTLTSDDPTVATVDAAGNVTLLKAGTTTIRAQITVMGIARTTTMTVNAE